ncbi:unnamed protein product [Lactuca saligna]|uniref:Uncharacterized protein n=1 Tax=Lactuca saligna TaxID=75948 RepID=A0AA35Y6M1_LACSI|nr:unnamed protein product [Lactuca saligna]
MKQKRGGKFIFEGKFPLIKFEIFEESDQSKSEDQSIPTESEDIVHSTYEPEFEEIHDSPTATVVEEHDHHKEDETKSSHEDDDDYLYGDVEFLKEIDFTGFSDDIPTNIELDLNDEEFGLHPGFPNSCLNKVNEVSSSATKTREEGNALKILLSTTKTMEVASSQGEGNALKILLSTTKTMDARIREILHDKA